MSKGRVCLLFLSAACLPRFLTGWLHLQLHPAAHLINTVQSTPSLASTSLALSNERQPRFLVRCQQFCYLQTRRSPKTNFSRHDGFRQGKNQGPLGHGRCSSNRLKYLRILLTRLQIVYLCLVSPLLLAAFLEWILWLGAFLFALCKVYQKAEHWSTKVIAVIMMILFTILRSVSAHALSNCS